MTRANSSICWGPSVEVAGEGNDRDEEVFAHHRHVHHVVCVLIPKLTRSHLHALATLLSADYLNHVLVTFVFFQVLQRMLSAVGQFLRECGQLIVLRIGVLELVVDQLLNNCSRLLTQI